ncbi:hypothetical protein QYR56_06760 [Streptococcus iniae]|nr:hypothetical protein QYR56_06760 [Streptococcus iniae]
MAFFRKHKGYSASLADQLLSGLTIKLASKCVKAQFDYETVGKDENGNDIKKRTNNIVVNQIFVATGSDEPFTVKFLLEHTPNLNSFEIGDIVEFEHLEAYEGNYNKIYFRATGIKKGK